MSNDYDIEGNRATNNYWALSSVIPRHFWLFRGEATVGVRNDNEN